MKTEWTEEELIAWERAKIQEIEAKRAALPSTCPDCGIKIGWTGDLWAPTNSCKPCALIYCELNRRKEW